MPATPTGLPPDATEGTSMSDFDRNYAAGRSVGYGRAAAVDAGLRAYMLRVYNYMAIGVALTGFAALFMFQLTVTEVGGRLAFTPLGQTLFQSGFQWVLLLAPLALVFFLSFRIDRLAP